MLRRGSKKLTKSFPKKGKTINPAGFAGQFAEMSLVSRKDQRGMTGNFSTEG